MTMTSRRPRQRSIPMLVATAALTLGLTTSLFAASGALGLAQTAPTPLPSPLPSTTTAATDTGRLLYLRDCAWCHGADGRGTPSGPSLEGVGAESVDFMVSTGRMPIHDPSEEPRRGPTPYTTEEIDALVRYVGGLVGGPGVPTVDPAAGSLAEGEDLYQLHCAACHSMVGIGGALTNGLVAPPLGEATPRQVIEAMQLGGAGLRSGNMPKFDQVLDRQQLDSVARFVQYLHHPDDHGGESLGHFGPVAEGFVAWLAAIGLLLVFVRWVGRRSV
jgi:ubiquinol-cytochrome c reductase cytochrome c subunit